MDWTAVGNAFLGTCFTWAATAAGAAVVYVARPTARFLDCSLGFASGVMLAASYWSLLAPSLERAAASGSYGPVWVGEGQAVGLAGVLWLGLNQNTELVSRFENSFLIRLFIDRPRHIEYGVEGDCRDVYAEL